MNKDRLREELAEDEGASMKYISTILAYLLSVLGISLSKTTPSSESPSVQPLNKSVSNRYFVLILP